MRIQLQPQVSKYGVAEKIEKSVLVLEIKAKMSIFGLTFPFKMRFLEYLG